MDESWSWLQQWWDELDEERRQAWLAAESGSSVPARLADQLSAYANRQNVFLPTVTGYFTESGGDDLHSVPSKVWEFIDQQRPDSED